MNQPYQLIYDIWEGNPDISPEISKKNGVVGLIVRLNSMSGGHHMDDRFVPNWALAQEFPIQSIYCVYNPWVDGFTNYDWFIKHLPPDFGKRRLFVDIEVRYPGYSPETYGKEVLWCMNRLRTHFPTTRYSGGGFLDILSKWPTEEEYWWASYSDDLTKSTTWAEYKKNLASLYYAAFTKLSPGPCRLWQASGDGVRLEGFGNHAVDVNVFPGSLEDAAEWFGCKLTDQPKEETNMEVPMGLFTRTAGWTKSNPNFRFIAGASQNKGTVEPNPAIKPIELEAHAAKIPFMLWWEHLPQKYAEQQWGEKNWPTIQNDYIFQNFKKILEARTYEAVVVSVLDGQGEDKAFLAFSAKQFLNRVYDWLKVNKPLVPLIMASSHTFMKTYAPDMLTWAHNFYSMAVQPATKLQNSYPVEGQKPDYFGIRNDCEWWRYYELYNDRALIVFRGSNGYTPTIGGMTKWLNLEAPVEVDDPPTQETPSDMDILKKRVTSLEQEIATIKAALKKPIME